MRLGHGALKDRVRLGGLALALLKGMHPGKLHSRIATRCRGDHRQSAPIRLARRDCGLRGRWGRVAGHRLGWG